MNRLFFIAITCITTANGMVIKYPAITPKPSIQLNKQRKLLETHDPEWDPSCSVIGRQKRGVCYNYTFSQFFNIIEPLKTMGCQDWITELGALSFFKQVEKPRRGCLALFTTNKNDFTIQHVAKVTNATPDNILVISKWGINDEIVKHPLFTMPTDFGDAVFFFELDKQYTQDFIIETFNNKISSSQSIQKELPQIQNDLFRLAKEKEPKFYTSFPSGIDLHWEKAFVLIKKFIGIDINGRDKKNRTALMLAATKGSLDMVELLIEYGADETLQDSQGKTPIQLAYEKINVDVVQFLRQKTNSGNI